MKNSVRFVASCTRGDSEHFANIEDAITQATKWAIEHKQESIVEIITYVGDDNDNDINYDHKIIKAVVIKGHSINKANKEIEKEWQAIGSC